MKHLFTKVSSVIMAAAVILTSGCYREIEERIDVVDQEIIEIDNTLAAMEATISSLSTVYATIKNFDELKGFAESLRGDLEELQNTFEAFRELADQTYATGESLTRVRNLAVSINDDLVDLKLTVGSLDLKVNGLDEAISKTQESIAYLSKLVYFITMDIVPEAVSNGAPAVLFNSDANSATVSVTLEVAPAARAKELVDHISFSIIPVATFTRAAETITIKGEEYNLADNGRLTVSAALPRKAPFLDLEYNLWNVEQDFVISAKYIDNDGLVQLSTPYVSAFLTSAGGTIPKVVSVILGEKNIFWEAVAEGAADAAAKLDDGFTLEVTYCSTQKEQAAALNNLHVASKRNKGIIIYPLNETMEEAVVLTEEKLNLPLVVVGKELDKNSSLLGLARTQVAIRDTSAIKNLCKYVSWDAHENVIIACIEDSKVSKERADAAQKYLSPVSSKFITTTLDKAEVKISAALELFEECTALVLLDDELITPAILQAAKNVKTYAFGSVADIKTGYEDGTVRAGMFKNGYTFGSTSFNALFNTTEKLCLIDAEPFAFEEPKEPEPEPEVPDVPDVPDVPEEE